MYEDLVKSRQNMNRKKHKKDNPNYVYYERHHIIPKCCEGTDEKSNLVLLTAKEHFIAHLLLIKYYEDSKNIKRKMVNALWKMCQNSSGQRLISSSQYVLARNLFAISHSSFMKGKATTKGIKISERGKENMRKARIGRKLTQQHKENIRKALKKIPGTRSIKVLQFDLSGRFIKKWPSIKSTSEVIPSHLVFRCLKSNNLAGGFIWKYEKLINVNSI